MGNAASKVVYTVTVRPLGCAKLFVYYFEGMEKLLKASEDWRATTEPLQSSNIERDLGCMQSYTIPQVSIQRSREKAGQYWPCSAYCPTV